MPFRSGNPIAAALAQSNDIQNGLGNLFAPFSPLNTMQAGLLKAQTDLATTKADVERGQLGLLKEKQPYEISEIQARTGAANSQAGMYQAGAREHDATTAQIKQQTQGLADMETAARDAGAPPQMAAVFGAASRGSGRNTTVQQLMGAFNDTFRPDPVKLGQGETAFFAQGPQGQRLDPRAPLPVQSEPAPSMVPQTQIPFSQGGFGLPSGYQPQGAPMLPQQGGAAPSSPLTVGAGGNLAGLPSPIQVQGNVVSSSGNPSRSATPLNKARDEAWGKALAENEAKGGTADIDNNLAKIDNALGLLKNAKTTTGVSGGITGVLPDIVNRGIGNGAAVDARQSIESAVSDTLRATLGAAFTAEEGKRTLKLAYDPTAPDSENIRRVTLLQNLLKTKAQTMKDAQAYADANGTMTGFQPMPISSHKALNDELEAAVNDKKAGSTAAGSQGDELVTVVSPSGQTGKIPKANLDAALKRGFKQK